MVIYLNSSLQLGAHIRGKRKREELQGVIQQMRKAAAQRAEEAKK